MHKLRCGKCGRFVSCAHPQGSYWWGNLLVFASTTPFVLCSLGHLVFIGEDDC